MDGRKLMKNGIFITILIILLLFVSVIIFIKYFRQGTINVDQTPSSINPNNSKSSRIVSLSFQPEHLALKASETGVLTVSLNGQYLVNAVDLDMTFNPEDIQITGIAPGKIFNNPEELVKKIDATGHILYTLGAAQASTASGTLAVLTITPLTKKGSGKILITSKTIVADVSGRALIVVPSSDLTYDIQ